MTDALLNEHKLAWHPERLAEWMRDRSTVYPIYVEVGLTNHCNHNCVFCSFDYARGGQQIDVESLCVALADMAGEGVRAVMFCGEGEPLLHPKAARIVQSAHSFGLDVAVNTNGTPLTEATAKAILPCLSWIRFSINAGSASTYATVHGCPPEHFWKAIHSIKMARDMKHALKLPVTIGTQSVLLQANEKEIISLAHMMKEIGVDYYTFKPMTGHPKRKGEMPQNCEAHAVEELNCAVESLQSDKFRVYIRENSFGNLPNKRPYSECYGIDLMIYIGADGTIWPCSNFLGDYDYAYGNISEGFVNVWTGRRREEVNRKINEGKLAGCRQICRQDQINRYLWRLKAIPEHVNFI